MSATDKISAMEKMLYGTEQAGALVYRMDSLKMMFMVLLPATLF